MLNGRKTIGIILFDITGYYQQQLVHTLSKTASKRGYNLLTFSAFTIYGSDTKNAAGEHNILHLIPYEQLDALIVCHDTFNSNEAVEELWKLVTERCQAPIISIRKKVNGCYNILVEDTDAIPAFVRHFHDVHHFDRIAFMSGPYNHPDAIFRLERYKEAMAELGLDCPEEYIFEGNFWRDCALDAAKHFMSLKKRPQAIVCANDYMALSLCKELTLQGYSVPHDIAISGFDDVRDARANVPPLTTCYVSVPDMAEKAMETIDTLLNGKEAPACTFVPTKIIIRNSCGCESCTMKDLSLSRMYEVEFMEQLINHNAHNTFVSISLENMTSAEDIGDYLRLEDVPGITRDFYLCLGIHGNGAYPQVKKKAPGFAKRSHSIYSLRDLNPIATSSFETKKLLPPEAIREEPMTVFFFPIHYLEYNFGYVATTSNGEEAQDTLFHSWLSLIGNTLENLRIRAKNQALLEKLNMLYHEDFLTKLYNRRGFEQFSEEEFAESKKHNIKTMTLSIDMDNLKYINDVYGHSHGDLALQTIADAMRQACSGCEICARIGGDEFAVFGYDYSEEKAKQYTENFLQYLKDFNAQSNLPYCVNASFGYTISDPSLSISREKYMKISDDLLYQNKRKRKEKYGNLSQR